VSGRDRPTPADESRSNEDRGDLLGLTLGSGLHRALAGYQRWLDQEMAGAGFPGRRFPDGRVLRLCAHSEQMTSAQIGRALGISRQAAGKIVAALRQGGFVALASSSGDGREKVVMLTPRAYDYLAAQRIAECRIERHVEEQIGPGALQCLAALLEVMGGTAVDR
jgi:DNA-binding MarR family transcriptional regulator